MTSSLNDSARLGSTVYEAAPSIFQQSDMQETADYNDTVCTKSVTSH